MSYDNMWGTQDAFERYEAVRHRMPTARFPDRTQDCAGLVEIADHFDAFVLDSFGVLNVAETAITGASAGLQPLRPRGKRLLALSNRARYQP